MLVEIENGLRRPRSEEAFSGAIGQLDVDHIMPRNWYSHWPLNNEKISYSEALDAYQQSMITDNLSDRKAAILRRERLKETFGNLTLANLSTNRGSGNREFSVKRDEFFENSTLHLNRQLLKLENWDESQIEARGKDLFEVARKIWPYPF
jgi:hypothetical protein